MISTADFGKGVRFLFENEPYEIMEVATQSPSARGAATLVKIKAKNLLTGKLINESIKAGMKFDQPDIHFAPVQYLYQEGSDFVFMDQKSYDQFNIEAGTIGDKSKYLSDGMELRALYFNGRVVNVEIPNRVTVKVDSVEPAVKGNTAGKITTKAHLDNGINVQVPLFVKPGDNIIVDTDSDTFVEKA